MQIDVEMQREVRNTPEYQKKERLRRFNLRNARKNEDTSGYTGRPRNPI